MAPGLRRVLSSIFLILLLLTVGIMTASWLISTKPKAAQSTSPRLPPLVEVHTVALEDRQEFFTGYGTARAEVDTHIASEVNGLVIEIAEGLDDGVQIGKGQLLVRIDDRHYAQQFARAQAMADDLLAQINQLDVEESNIQRLIAIAESEVQVNRNEMDRVAGLLEKQQASSKEADFARLAYQQSRRQLVAYKNQVDLIGPRRDALKATHAARLADAELAKLDIERCRIKAPFEGSVVRLAVELGDHVQVGTEVVRVIATRLVEVPIELPASVRPRLQVGAKTSLEADSTKGSDWVGRVARVAPLTDSQSRTFAAYVEVDNEKQVTPLVPGVFLTARVDGPVHSQSLAVPRGALVNGTVFVVNNDRAHERSVRINSIIDEWAIVSGDLNPGDRVITTNLDVLTDGAAVRVDTAEEKRNGLNNASPAADDQVTSAGDAP